MGKKSRQKTMEIYYPSHQYNSLINIPKSKSIDFAVYFGEFLNRDNYKLLELGCSTGNFLSNDPKNIVGIDINKNSLKVAKNRGFQVIRGDVEHRLCFKDNAFDAIFASCVIEHLCNPINFLKECHRLLIPNGLLVVITDDFAKQYKTFYDDPTHIFPLTREGLRRCAVEAGFKHFRIERQCVPTGMGLLLRNGIIGIKNALRLTRFLYKIGVYKHKFGKGHIVLVARKVVE